MASIFLSYASADRVLADHVTKQIGAVGHHVFRDSDHENGIAPGTTWERTLFHELRICDAVVFLNSGVSQASHWCHSELALAASLGKQVYPLDLGPGLAPHPLLQAVQGIAFDGTIDTGIHRLIGSLARDGRADASVPRWQRDRPPYPGLLWLDVADAGVFFGREADVKKLIDRANRSLAQPGGDLIVVMGPSGSGKSSLVRAGLAARLGARRSDWAVMRPFEPRTGPLEHMVSQLAALAPDQLTEDRCRDRLLSEGLGSLADWLLDRLASHPAAPPKRLLITLDQAEQLAALQAEKKQEFLALLGGGLGPSSPVTVVTTVRSDRFGEIQQLPVIGSRIDEPFIIRPIGRAQLTAVIEEPARLADLSFAPGLAGLIIDEATQGGRSEVDALPFLAFTLREMYELAKRENRDVITEAYYDQVDRIEGAIVKGTQTAESRLPRGSKPKLDLLLQRFVTVTEDTPAAGRAVSDDKLTPVEQAIVGTLEDHRLLTSDEGSVRLTHDQLITAWPRLKRVVEESRGDLLLEGRIERQAADWRRDQGGLLRRGDATAAAAWLARQAAEGTDHPALAKYIHASRSALRRQVLTGAVIVISLVALTAVSVTFGTFAVHTAANADHQATLAVAGQLAALSEAVGVGQEHGDPVTAALLAAAAWQEAPGAEQARESMLQVLAQPVHAVLTEDGPITSIAFSPGHGGILATAGRAIVLYRLATGRPIGSPITVPGGARGLAFNAAGTMLATADHDGTARLWDVATGREIGSTIRASSSIGVNAVAFSPGGTMLATADSDGTARLWNIATHRQIGHALVDGGQVITGNQVTDVAFSPSGKILATASRDGTARLWSIATQRQIGQAMTDGHTFPDIHEMFAVAFNPLGNTLATADQDGLVGLWDVATQHRRGPLIKVAGADDVTFSPDGKIIAVAENGGLAALWVVATRTPILPVLGDITEGSMSAVAFGPGGAVLATVSTIGVNGVARLWDLTNFRNIALPVDVGGSHDIAFSRDGRTVASIDADLAVRVWNLSTGRQAAKPILASETGGPSAVAFSPDGKTLATGDDDGTVRLWNLGTGRQAAKPILASETAGVAAVAFSPDGKILATGEDDGTVRLWNPRTGQSAGALGPRGSEGASILAFGPGGARLAAVYTDGKVRLWDMTTRQTVSLSMPTLVDGVAFSPDGSLLATADENGTALLWKLKTGQQYGAPMIATGIDNVAGVSFSPDGSLLATAGGDGDARVWDVQTQHEIGPAMVGGSAASGLDAVAFTSDGSALATVAADGTAALWGIEFPHDLLGAVCAIAGRSLTRQEWNTYIQTAPYIKGCP